MLYGVISDCCHKSVSQLNLIFQFEIFISPKDCFSHSKVSGDFLPTLLSLSYFFCWFLLGALEL